MSSSFCCATYLLPFFWRMDPILQMSLYKNDGILASDKEEWTHLHNPVVGFGRQPSVCSKTRKKGLICAFPFSCSEFPVLTNTLSKYQREIQIKFLENWGKTQEYPKTCFNSDLWAAGLSGLCHHPTSCLWLILAGKEQITGMVG